MELIFKVNLVYLAIINILPLFTWRKISLKTFTKIHNIILITWSIYILQGICKLTYHNNYMIWGNDTTCKMNDIKHYTKMFYYSKIYEFIDSFIMIAKRNFHQLSFLHIYHHSSVSLLWWYLSTYYPCGDVYIPIVLNSIVHIIMYTNYTLNTSKNKTIKQFVTRIQLFQFILMIIHSLRFVFHPTLGHLCMIQGTYIASMLYLFTQFYKTTYLSKSYLVKT